MNRNDFLAFCWPHRTGLGESISEELKINAYFLIKKKKPWHSVQRRGEQPSSKAPFMALLYLGKPAGGPIASSSNPLQASPEAQLVKNPPANARDASLIPGLVRSPGEGNGNPLQYSCLENSMARGA